MTKKKLTSDRTDKPIKIRINSRTIVMVKTNAARDMWLKRHPEATVISDAYIEPKIVDDDFMGHMLSDGIRNIQVEVAQFPISERYCSVGSICTLDMKNKRIRCSGVWFAFDDRWIVTVSKEQD